MTTLSGAALFTPERPVRDLPATTPLPPLVIDAAPDIAAWAVVAMETTMVKVGWPEWLPPLRVYCGKRIAVTFEGNAPGKLWLIKPERTTFELSASCLRKPGHEGECDATFRPSPRPRELEAVR